MRTSSIVLRPAAPASVAVARRRLMEELLAARIFAPVIDDASLVISDLLSNAIRHARPLPGSQLQVSWRRAPLRSRPATAAARPGPLFSSVAVISGGRGLGFVAHLSHSWGMRDNGEGLTVRAVVAAPPECGNGSAGCPL